MSHSVYMAAMRFHKRKYVRFLWNNAYRLVITLLLSVALLPHTLAEPPKRLPPATPSTVVRFFYLPPDSYLHPALFLRVAGSRSKKLKTAPFSDGGRTAYLSLSEMSDLLVQLRQANIRWMFRAIQRRPGGVSFAATTDKLEATVFTPSGVYDSLSDPKELCANLAAMDKTLQQPRALWEFQLFRVEYGCRVPNFARDRYHDHDESALKTGRR